MMSSFRKVSRFLASNICLLDLGIKFLLFLVYIFLWVWGVFWLLHLKLVFLQFEVEDLGYVSNHGFEDSVEEGIGKIDDDMVNDGNNEKNEECILLEIIEEETDNKSDGNNQKEEYVLLEVEKRDDDENEDNVEDNFVDDGQKEVYVHWELNTKDDVEDNFVDNNQMEEYVQLDVEENDYVEDEDTFVDDFGNENDFEDEEDVDGFVVGREELVAGSTLKRQRQELEDLVHLIVNLLYRFILQVIFIINVLNYFISNFLFINVIDYFANAIICSGQVNIYLRSLTF